MVRLGGQLSRGDPHPERLPTMGPLLLAARRRIYDKKAHPPALRLQTQMNKTPFRRRVVNPQPQNMRRVPGSTGVAECMAAAR